MNTLLVAVAPIAGVAIFVAILAVVIVAAVRTARKSRANLTRIAGELGLQLVEKPLVLGFFRPTPTVEGNRGGRMVRVFEFTTGTSKRKVLWSAVSVGCGNPHGFQLRLGPQNFLTELGEKFGLQDLSVGDPVFDRKFVVQTNAPDYLRAALLPEIRDPLLRLWPAPLAGAMLKIEGGAVVYAETLPFSEVQLLTRMKSMLDVLVTLTALPEVYAA